MTTKLERQSLSGVDARGEMNGGADYYSAEKLIVRLARGMREGGGEALRWSPDEWAEKMDRRRADLATGGGMRLHPVYSTSQERALMQVLGVGLGLATSHHPSLLGTFPWLLKWILRTLEYVVELEGRVEAGLEYVEQADKAAEVNEEVRVRQRAVISHLRSDIDDMSDARAEDEAAYLTALEALRTDMRDRDRDLAALQTQADAWKLSAQVAATALAVTARQAGIDIPAPAGPHDITPATQIATTGDHHE